MIPITFSVPGSEERGCLPNNSQGNWKLEICSNIKPSVKIGAAPLQRMKQAVARRATSK